MATSTLEATRAIAPIIDEHLEAIERDRLFPKAVVGALIDAGVFRMLVPRSLGGTELDPVSVCEVVEELSTHDGAVGWCGAVGASGGLFGGLLPRAGAAEIYADRDVVLAGQFRPGGTATQADGGYRVTGRWPFASGIMHSQWLMGGCQIVERGGAATGEARLMFLRREDATVIDTWDVGGLRATGSHDFEVKDIIVPASRTVSFADPPVEPGPLYSMPSIAMFATMIASVPLGIARHAIEAFKRLGGVKKSMFSQGLLLQQSAVAQAQLGEAEAYLRAGRAFLFESLRSAWALAQRGERLSWHDRGLLWLSATQAVTQALHAVDLVYRAGSSASVYTSTRLERCLRDIRTAAQHVTVMTPNYEVAGQLFFGADVSRTVWSRDSKRTT
jgi:alkylation response protein AidB-like acyl-CoA dehydrogenase